MNTSEIQRALKLWFLTLEGGGRSPHTITTYQAHMHTILKWLGSRDLNVETWRFFMAETMKTHSPFSARAYCATARSFMSFCVSEELVEDNSLLKKMKLPRVPDTPRQALSSGQIQALLTYLSADRRAFGVRNYAAVLILLDTGLRLSELVGLELDDLQDDCLYVRHSKNGMQRAVPLGQQAYSALLRFLASARPRLNPADDSLWAGWSRNAVQNMMRKLSNKLGFNVNPHMMRHSFVTHAVKAGGDLETVRRIAGWRDYRMLQTYAHLSTDDLRERHREFSLGDKLAARPPRSSRATRAS